MTPLEFLKAVWPTDGHYCIAVPFKIPNTSDVVYAHYVFDTIEEAAEFAEKKKDNVFFAVHSLKEKQRWNPNKVDRKTGEMGAFEKRVQANMQEARAFFFDLDVDASGQHEGKYASQHEALADLIRFCKETKLPKPLVTSSGGGLHVYWRLEDSMLSDQWRVQAARLRQLARHYKLKADPARTTDTASVLRVAGTNNLKTDTKRPVEVKIQGTVTPNDQFLKMLTDAMTVAGISATTVPKKNSLLAELGNNLDRDWNKAPVPFAAVLKACGLFQQLARRIDKMSEPEWYQSLNIIRFCENGDAVAHKFSSKHPGYSYDETEKKLENQKHRRIDDKPLGPTSCKVLGEVCGNTVCQTCVFKDKVKNPLMAATYKDDAPPPEPEIVIDEETVKLDIPPPPKPYQRLKDGRVVIFQMDKNGDEGYSTVYENDLYPLRRVRNGLTGDEEQLWRVHFKHDGVVDFTLEPDALYDERKLATSLAKKGIYPGIGDFKLLRGYMSAYIQELQRAQKADAQYAHLGWTEDQKNFVLPGKMYTPQGVEPASLNKSAENGTTSIRKKGTLEAHVKLLEFYNRPDRLAHQFFILCALGAPIFKDTLQHGIIINATGKAGSSKSTTLYTAASIWGDPKLFTIDGTYKGSTANGLNERVNVFANLPICVDEITKMPDKEMVNLVMGVTQPQSGKIRTKRDGSLREVPETLRSTMMLTTANVSLHAVLSNDDSSGTAGSMRVLEIFFPFIPAPEKISGDDFLYALGENSGHIGEQVIQYVVKNSASVSTRVREMMRKLDLRGKFLPSERFWSAAMAAALVGGEIAFELGLIKFDLDAIFNWLIEVQLPHMRGVVTEEYTTPLATLTEYLEQINSNIIVLSKAKSNNMLLMERQPHGALLAHYDMADQTLWVLKKGFKDYCTRTGANSTQILEALHAAQMGPDGKMSRIVSTLTARKILGAGTDYAKAQSRCFIINMAHPEISGSVDLKVVKTPSATVTPPKETQVTP